MKYLISGINGFIGTAIANRLLSEGHDFIGIERDMLHKPAILKVFLAKQQPDYIIHLAAYGNHYNQTDERNIIETNIIGTFNLLQAAKEVSLKKFYNFSSSSVTLSHETFYSASKLAAEGIANAFVNKYGCPVVNIRPYSVYGPGEAAHRFIPTVIKALQTGEEITVDEYAQHDWIFVEDFVTAMLNGETEIGTGKQHTNKEVVEMLQNISGKKLNYKTGTLRSYDNQNWIAKKGVPHIDLYEGLKITYEKRTS